MKIEMADVIKAFGGATALSELLGVTLQAVSNMRARGTLPPRHWQTVIKAAKARIGRADVTPEQAGILKEISFETLAAMLATQQARKDGE